MKIRNDQSVDIKKQKNLDLNSQTECNLRLTNDNKLHLSLVSARVILGNNLVDAAVSTLGLAEEEGGQVILTLDVDALVLDGLAFNGPGHLGVRLTLHLDFILEGHAGAHGLAAQVLAVNAWGH